MVSKVALGLTIAGALTCGLIGCGDGSGGTNASAEAAASGKTAAGASAKGSAAPKSSAATADTAKPATTAGGATASAGVLKHMPKDCDEGRVYANVGKILTGDTGTALDALIVKGMAMGKDAKKGDAVMKVLKDGGIDPVKGLKEVAVCMTKDDTKMVVAVAMDMSKADKPGDVLAKAIETGDGKAPKKEEKDGVTYLSNETGGKDVLAIVGKDILVVGKDMAMIEAAVKGGGGEADFGPAASEVVWAKVTKDNTQVDMKEAGDNFDLKVSMNDKQAAKKKEEAEKMLPGLDKQLGQLPPDVQKLLTPLLPIAKNAKFDVQGETLSVTTNFPKAALGEFLTAAGQSKPEDLMKGLKF
jgi:hypothetical protein